MTGLRPSWVAEAAGSGFDVDHLPLGVDPRHGVLARIGPYALPLTALPVVEQRAERAISRDHPDLVAQPTLNPFLAAGPEVWTATRDTLQEALLDPAAQPKDRGFDFTRDYVVWNALANRLYKRRQYEAPGSPARTEFLHRAVKAAGRVLAEDAEDVEAHDLLTRCYAELAGDKPTNLSPTALSADDGPDEQLDQIRRGIDRSCAAIEALSGQFSQAFERSSRATQEQLARTLSSLKDALDLLHVSMEQGNALYRSIIKKTFANDLNVYGRTRTDEDLAA